MRWLLRIIAGLALLLFVALGALAILSTREEFKTVHAGVVIHRPPEAIWPWLYDPDKLKSWVSWLVEVRGNGNSPPSPGMRATWVMEDRNNGGQRMDIESVVEQVEPGQRLLVKLTVHQFRGQASYTLVAHGEGGTELLADNHYELDNSFARLMTPLITWQARKKLDSDLAHLRTLVESAP